MARYKPRNPNGDSKIPNSSMYEETEIDIDYYRKDWNIIPYGTPSECKKKLLVIIDGKYEYDDLFKEAITHLTKSCKDTTNLVHFHVKINLDAWEKAWSRFEQKFSILEDNDLEIKIFFY